MGETGFFKVKNLNELAIPVDKQVARFTMYTRIIKLLSEQFHGCVHEPPLRGLDTSPWKLDEPICEFNDGHCEF